jgi:hypothetical protein
MWQLDAPCRERRHTLTSLEVGINLKSVTVRVRGAGEQRGTHCRPASPSTGQNNLNTRNSGSQIDTCQTVNGHALTTVKSRALALGRRNSAARNVMER